jgi:hypothetical protein
MNIYRNSLFGILLLSLSTALLLPGCDSLSREIELDLPEYERELNVECYLIPGVPIYFLSLTETVGYFDEFDLPVIDDATVVIEYGSEVDTLLPVNLLEGFVLPGFQDTIRLFLPGASQVYIGLRTSPDNINTPFTLTVNDEIRDRRATATARLMPRIAHDTSQIEFNDDGEALVLTRFTDPPGERNYYRRILKKKEPRRIEGTEDTLWVSDVEQAFVFDDELQDGQQITLGTGFSYAPGDTLISYIYHIEKTYYDYLQSTDGAITANFNPFGQPSRILSNIRGQGTGIFTGLAMDIDTVIIR